MTNTILIVSSVLSTIVVGIIIFSSYKFINKKYHQYLDNRYFQPNTPFSPRPPFSPPPSLRPAPRPVPPQPYRPPMPPQYRPAPLPEPPSYRPLPPRPEPPSYRPLPRPEPPSYRPLPRPEPYRPTYRPYLLPSLDDLDTRSGLETRSLDQIIEEKEGNFLSIPNVIFHYADEEQIISFYNDYFKEPRIEELVSELIDEASGDIKGSIPQFIEARMDGKDISKWISKIKLPELSTAAMFLRIQRETIKNGQVTLGLEEVEIELEELDYFESLQRYLQNNYGLNIDDKTLESVRARLKTKASERTLSKLEHATGWAAVEGRFTIEQASEGFYKCTYTHPVSKYLSESDTPITISVFVRVSSLEDRIAGNYMQSIGKQIPLKIYGKVWQPIDRHSGVWDFQITPIAIY